jgi:hypothetical protein
MGASAAKAALSEPIDGLVAQATTFKEQRNKMSHNQQREPKASQILELPTSASGANCQGR